MVCDPISEVQSSVHLMIEDILPPLVLALPEGEPVLLLAPPAPRAFDPYWLFLPLFALFGLLIGEFALARSIDSYPQAVRPHATTSTTKTPSPRTTPRIRHIAPVETKSASASGSTDASPKNIHDEILQSHGKGFLKILEKQGTGRILIETAPQVRSDTKTGMYLGAVSVARPDFLQQTMDDIVAQGGNALVIEVKGGDIYFDSTSAMAKKFGSIHNIYNLPDVIAAAHAKGLYVIGRFVSLKDTPLADADPSTQIRNPATGVSVGDAWVDPGMPDTIEYNREIIDDLLRAGIDEVNLDYIRYPTEYSMASIGLATDQKESRLESFVRMARSEIDALRPQTKLGMSTYAILGWDFQINDNALGQNFVRFAPLIDVISPMAYPSSFTDPSYYDPAKNEGSRAYHLVYRTLTGYKNLLPPDQVSKIRPWLQAYSMTPTQITDEIHAVYDAGMCGFTFWNASNSYAPAYSALSASQAFRPNRCK